MKSFLQLKFIPVNPDLGLLVLRLWLGASMIILHGLPKLKKIMKGDFNFSDHLHIGSKTTVILATSVELLGSAFLILGFLGRPAALALAVAMGIAFGIWHEWNLRVGELAYVYLAGFITIFLAGTGKYGIDRK